MKRHWFLLILVFSLWLAACQPEMLSETAPSAPQPTQAPTTSSTQTTAPAAAATLTQPAQSIKTPTLEKPDMPQSPEATSAYPPETKDATMTRGNFFVDSAVLKPVAGKDGYYTLMAEGSLPTPCNLPRVVVNPPDSAGTILVEAYSVVPKDQMCTEVLKPFSGKLAEIGGYPSGKYKVMVNDVPAGEISLP